MKYLIILVLLTGCAAVQEKPLKELADDCKSITKAAYSGDIRLTTRGGATATCKWEGK